jgi:hypothetical protein
MSLAVYCMAVARIVNIVAHFNARDTEKHFDQRCLPAKVRRPFQLGMMHANR